MTCPPPFVTKLDLKIPPVGIWFTCAGAIMICDRWLPGTRVSFPGHRVVAGGLMLAGIAIALAGVREFRRAGTTLSPLASARASTVVASGIYRRTRNPMYVGMAASLAGVAAWSASLPGLGLVAVFCGYLTAFQIKPEEQALLARFGPPYAAYLARVRRWL